MTEGKREKRKYLRIDISLLLEYRPVKTELYRNKSIAENISEGGLLLSLPDRFEKGDVLSVKLALPSAAEGQHVSALVKVAWTKFDNRRNVYNTGVCFVDISEDSLKRVKEYVDYVK